MQNSAVIKWVDGRLAGLAEPLLASSHSQAGQRGRIFNDDISTEKGINILRAITRAKDQCSTVQFPGICQKIKTNLTVLNLAIQILLSPI